MKISERLVKIRERNGYTRKRLADELRRPYATITKYETGEREPGHSYIIEIAQKFGVTTDYILGIDNNLTPKTTPPVSGEAMQLAKDYDTLDQWGRRAVRSAADNELARVKSQTERTVVPLPPRTVAARGDHVGEGIPNDQIDEDTVNAEVARLDPNRGLDTR